MNNKSNFNQKIKEERKLLDMKEITEYGKMNLETIEHTASDEERIFGSVETEYGITVNVTAPIGMTAAEMDELDLPKTWFLIPGMFMTGLVIFAAEPNLGKSTFCSQLAYSAATGGDFLHRKVEHCKVLYMDLENGADETKERFELMGLDLKEAGDNLIFVSRDDLLKPINKGFEEQLVLYKKQFPELRLVIVDTLSKIATDVFSSRDYYKESEVLGDLRKLAKGLGIVLLCVHHMSKLKSDNTPFASIYGSNAMGGSSDVIMAMYKKKDFDMMVLSLAGNKIPKRQIYCRLQDMHWEFIADEKEKDERFREMLLRQTPEFRAVCRAYETLSVDGVLKFFPSELAEYAGHWDDVGYIENGRSLAGWIRRNKEIIGMELAVDIREKRVAKGKQFMFCPVGNRAAEDFHKVVAAANVSESQDIREKVAAEVALKSGTDVYEDYSAGRFELDTYTDDNGFAEDAGFVSCWEQEAEVCCDMDDIAREQIHLEWIADVDRVGLSYSDEEEYLEAMARWNASESEFEEEYNISPEEVLELFGPPEDYAMEGSEIL